MSDQTRSDQTLPPELFRWDVPPQQLPGRTRRAGIWMTAWVEYGRPVILDTRQLLTAHDARRRTDIPLDDERLRRYQGGDPFPADALLVLIHPKTYRDLKMTRDLAILSGPEAAAGFIDGACKLTPGLEDRIGWRVIGGLIDDDDE